MYDIKICFYCMVPCSYVMQFCINLVNSHDIQTYIHTYTQTGGQKDEQTTEILTCWENSSNS